MSPSILSVDAYRRSISVRDLTDPNQGPHAMQLLVRDIGRALERPWRCRTVVHRACPVVPVEDNYDRLGYEPDAAARDARHTRYVSSELLLRSQTSAMIPALLSRIGQKRPDDLLIACPGIVYRRDTIDRLHTGEPHQLDLWRLTRHVRLCQRDLLDMIGTVVAAALPGVRHRTLPAEHPYTTGGLQIDVDAGESGWIEIGECGLAAPLILANAGIDPKETSGLAMGLGLDRLVMLRKGVDDIRLLRSEDPRVADQMLDLTPYRPVSRHPAIARDLSVAVPADTTPEELGDAVRHALGEHADAIESVSVLDETAHQALPPQAVARMGMSKDQKNVLLRVVIRHPVRTLTHPEANALRDRVYRAIHRGMRHEWALGVRSGT